MKELADELAERRRDAGVWEQALSLSVAETEKLHLEQESLRVCSAGVSAPIIHTWRNFRGSTCWAKCGNNRK